MAVNESIWVNSIDDANFRNLAKTTTLTPRQLQINGTWGSFPYEDTWDNSICFCGMDKASGSYLANAGVVVQTHDSVLPLYKDNDITNWNFGSTNQGSGSSDGSFDNYNNWSRFANWQTPTTTGIDQTDYQGYNIKAVHSLQIKKLLLVPYIYATSVNTSSTSSSQEWTGPLHTYLGTTTIQNNYHYIRQVAFVLYYNNGTDDNPNWSDLSTSVSTRYYMQMCPHFFSDELLSAAPPQNSSVSMTTSMCIHGGIFNNQRNWHPLIGNFTKSVSEGLFRYRPILYDTDLSHYKTTGTLGSNISQIWYCRDWATDKDDILDDIRKQLAFYGMFYVGDNGFSSSSNLYDSCIYCGIIDNGITYGNYTHGVDNRLQPQWDWTDTNDSDYDPSNPPSQDRNSDPVTFNPVTLANGGLKRYVLDDNAMSAFGIDLYNVIDTSNPDELIQNQTLTNFLTNNPLDAVVSVKRFPLPDMSQGSLTNIMLGKVQMQTAAKPFASTATILTCGSVNIPAKFGNFLDYETQYELILPFCGTLSLDPKIVTGRSVEVKYSIDYTTGTCTAWILTVTSDGVVSVIDSANGNCTIDIPLSGVQTATLTGEIYNANENLKTTKFNAVVNAVSGVGDFAKDIKNRDVAGGVKTVANVVNTIHDIKKAEWNINNTQIPFKMIGASSGCNSFQIELTPRLNVYYPIVDTTYNAANYRHNVGAAVCDTTTIGNYSGYAEITNIDLSGFMATAEEKNMIANALMGGVYL